MDIQQIFYSNHINMVDTQKDICFTFNRLDPILVTVNNIEEIQKNLDNDTSIKAGSYVLKLEDVAKVYVPYEEVVNKIKSFVKMLKKINKLSDNDIKEIEEILKQDGNN